MTMTMTRHYLTPTKQNKTKQASCSSTNSPFSHLHVSCFLEIGYHASTESHRPVLAPSSLLTFLVPLTLGPCFEASEASPT